MDVQTQQNPEGAKPVDKNLHLDFITSTKVFFIVMSRGTHRCPTTASPLFSSMDKQQYQFDLEKNMFQILLHIQRQLLFTMGLFPVVVHLEAQTSLGLEITVDWKASVWHCAATGLCFSVELSLPELTSAV